MLDGTERDQPEPNLHVCGKDGMKRVVYNMKEKHEEKRGEDREKHKEHSGKKLANQRTVFVSKENRLLYQF